MSIDEYTDFLDIPFEKIESSFNYFANENLLTEGTSFKVYKGQLLQSGDLINIVARRCLQRTLVTNERMISANLKHKNITSALKLTFPKDEDIIINKHEANGSLNTHLGGTTLPWMRRLHICIRVAHALKYIHYDAEDNHSVIHCNIKSSKILLDHNWEPKLHGFGFAVRVKKHHLHPTSKYSGSLHYMDPSYDKSGGLTHKSDVFSFGVLLFEVLFGIEASIPNNDNWYFARLARSRYEKRTLDHWIDPELRKQMNFQSFNIFTETAYSCLKEHRPERPDINQVLLNLEKALEVQHEHAYRLQEISLATNNFSQENLITAVGLGRLYKGRLMLYEKSKLMDIVVRRLECKYGRGDALQTEISMLYSLKHKNIISVVGYCDEDGEKIVIYEQALHGCLDLHLRDPTLTWSQRLQICLGVSRALSYVHYDAIHCDINSSKILLDEDWEPKIFGFELSTKYPQSWKHRILISRYIDKTNMTPKYDVYCFGVLLFEVIYGRKPMKTEHGAVEVDDVIDPNLRKQMNTQSLIIVKKITYNCLNEHLPTMDQIVKELEDALEHQWKHGNLVLSKEHSTSADVCTSSNRLKMKRLNIPLSKIMTATNNFDEAYCIGSGGYGRVYKATLDVLDTQNLSLIEGKTVAIKRITDRQDEQGKTGFLTEIELLTSCNHPNIVTLLGFSEEGREMILVYEYAFKGSLSDYFGNTSNKINLTWAQRIQICLDIAHGINYLHTNMEGKPRIIHRDIKSENILLDENLKAMVADFGLSKVHPTDQQGSTVCTKTLAGTEFYMDPEYITTSKYKKESDIYSFGVVLFEILTGRLAYDTIYTNENDGGLAPIARRHFNEGTLKKLIDPKIVEEDDEHFFTLNRGPNQDSFEAFSRIAYQCLAETRAKRPTIEGVIKELKNALNLQGETMVLSRFQLSDIKSATNNFSSIHYIASHPHGLVYKAELDFDDKSSLAFKEQNDYKLPKTRITVAIKRFSISEQFLSEIELRTSYKHPNVVSLLGFCDEGDEMILVYEHATNKSLEDYLKSVDYDNNLTWTQRLHMCLEIAHGLDHLHTKIDIQHRVIRGDIIRSANILLGKNWEPKIAYFGILECNSTNQEGSIVIRKKNFSDPELEKLRVAKQESDIYSFGVILFEIFCGRLAYEKDEGLAPIARQRFNDGTIKEMIDPDLKEATDEDIDIITSNRGPNQDSLDTFLKIAYRCLEEVEAERPTLKDVIKELEIALNYQENLMKSLQIPLKDIDRATEKFSQKNFFGSGRYWKAYKGKLPHANGSANTPIVANRWDTTFNVQFQTELNILFKRKHENIIGLIGYCDELNEKIIVYEHMPKGSLDKHLEDPSLTWMKRLKICVDVAKGLEFLHSNQMKHRGITSGSVLLDGHWTARISNLELACKSSVNNRDEHIDTNAYVDPEYQFSGFASEKSDIYSLGVILFEMLCGRLAWTPGCEGESKSLASFVVRHYTEKGNLDEMIFEDIKEQIVPQSLTTFQRVALQCLKDECVDRPEASDVVTQLKKALKFQENIKGNLHISLQAIELGTQNSSHSKCIGEGIFWKLYEGEVTHAKGCTIIFAKQWNNMSRQAYYQFWTELECLFKYNHKNIIGLVGYCNEMNEKIIFYEHASNGRLSTHLDDPILTWRKRLKICIDIVNGLEFLHTGGVELEDSIIHRDIKSGSILLDGGWNAKISNLELSCSTMKFERAEHVDDMACNSLGYVDPQYQIDGFLSEKSDIYSLGVILIEMLCGRLAWAHGYEDHSQSLGPLAVRYYNEKGNLDGMIFEGIKKQIAPKSLTTFLRIAIQCLKDDMVDRPSIREAGIQLKMALEFQEDYEIWEPKMPLDLEQIIQTSATPEIYGSTELKKDLYNMLSKGILRQDCKVLSSVGISGETNEMISARNFSYENRGSHKWRSIHKSGFPKVAKMFDISNLQIRINITTQFLSLGVNYGAYFVFKFCNTRKFSCKPVYVNLKYKMGGETLHAYFATWRDNEWMMIELWRFLSHKKDTSFEVLLESFSSYYCGSGPIYVDGIEFRVIDNVIDSREMCKRSENDVGEAEKSILLNEVNGKKHLRLSAKEVSNVKLSADSRYQEVVELLPQQVFRINCKIQSQVSSPDAKYLCYLVFKLSEKCHGLHCPVKVRDLLHRNNKEVEIIYFRCPSPWNLHNNSYPEQREDGWMEVKVCKFNSNHQLRNGCMEVNLKFITYEGTMSGLILLGLELRPMYL